MTSTKSVRVALDWTPNTNHTGMYVACANKWYEAAGLSVAFIVPQGDITPGTLQIQEKSAHLFHCPVFTLSKYPKRSIPNNNSAHACKGGCRDRNCTVRIRHFIRYHRNQQFNCSGMSMHSQPHLNNPPGYLHFTLLSIAIAIWYGSVIIIRLPLFYFGFHNMVV